VSGKRTLAVRLGDAGTRVLYISCVVAAFVALVPIAVSRFGALLAMLAVPLAARPIHAVDSGASGRRLVDVLQETGRLQLAFAVLLAVGIAL
jgi:1,4-dihydroxy-2-naphthoate octaprenyltransferase